jgi:4-amino-4-deoxy-L-arabinose transferase-like glycosyltransferase
MGAAAIAVSLFSHLGAIGFLGPDEPRYAWIARAMATTGDWVTPRLYGQPWFEKPVLYYWAAAVGFLAHLPSEWAARLPSAFAALAAALAIGWLGWKHYADEGDSWPGPAVLAPVIFSTSVAAIGFARAATPDMLFSASLAKAMASAATVLRHTGALRAAPGKGYGEQHGSSRAVILFGAFLGLAVLAKGPAAILLAGGAVALWVLKTKQWRAALPLAHPFAIAACCIIALPWYIACERRNPDFLRIFILQHNFQRYLTPVFHHRQPFWFFGPVILLALLPWTALLWPAAREGLRMWRAKSWKDSPGLFFACWAVFPVLFFSCSQSKLPGYILPAIPPLALVCSVGAFRAFREGRALAVSLCAALGVTWVALAAAALVFARRIPWSSYNPDYTPGVVTFWKSVAVGLSIALAAGLAAAGFRRKPQFAIALCAVCVAATLGGTSLRVLPVIDAFSSARRPAEFLQADRRPDRIFTYHLERSWDYGLAFYFHRELPEWSPADPDPALVLTTPKGYQEIRALGRFHGSLDEAYVGVFYVPVPPAPR